MSNNKQLSPSKEKTNRYYQLKGLLKKSGRLKNNYAKAPGDISGFDYIIHGKHEGHCYQYFVGSPPLDGMTQAESVPCPVGIEIFNSFKIGYREAIQIFHSGNWGDSFSSIILSKPESYPPSNEPFWNILSNLGLQVIIGANSGKIISPN